MEVFVLAQVQWQKIATPKTVQVSIFFLLYFADLFTWKTCVMWNSLIMTKFYASKVVVKLWYPKFTYSPENFIFAVNCKWSNWRSYSSCSKTCGGGTQSRSRSKTINEANGGSCPGSSTMTRDCNTQNCPSKYLFWLCFADLFTWKKCVTWNSLTNRNVVFLKENIILLNVKYYRKCRKIEVLLR